MKHQRCDLLVHFQNPGVFQEKKKSRAKALDAGDQVW